MKQTFRFTGDVDRVGELQTFDSGFTKREIVLTTGGEYPQLVKIEFLKDDTRMVENLNKGMNLTVEFELRGNDWKGKIFTNLIGISVEINGDTKPLPTNDNDDNQEGFDYDPDDLPF